MNDLLTICAFGRGDAVPEAAELQAVVAVEAMVVAEAEAEAASWAVAAILAVEAEAVFAEASAASLVERVV